MRRKFKHGSWYWCKRFKHSEWEPMKYEINYCKYPSFRALLDHGYVLWTRHNLYVVGTEIIHEDK